MNGTSVASRREAGRALAAASLVPAGAPARLDPPRPAPREGTPR